MKYLFIAVLLLCVAAPFAHGDVIVPKPTGLTVSNLAAFPKYKFTIAVGDKATPQPLEDGKACELNSTAQLLVQDADTKPQTWATVEHRQFSPGGSVHITVKSVRHDDKGITVTFDKEEKSNLRPRKLPPRTADAWPHFLLAGLSCCGLVLLYQPHRRRRQTGPS